MPEEEAVPDREVPAVSDATEKGEAPGFPEKEEASVPAEQGDIPEAGDKPEAPQEALESETIPVDEDVENTEKAAIEHDASKEAPVVSSDDDASIDVDADSDSEPVRTAAVPASVPPRRVPEVDRDPDAHPTHKDIAIDVDGLDDSFDEDEDGDEDHDDDEDHREELENEDEQHREPTATIDLTESVEGTPPRQRHQPPNVDDDDDAHGDEEDGDRPLDAGTTAQDALGSESEPVDVDTTAEDALGSGAEPLDTGESEEDSGESEAEPSAEQGEHADEVGDETASAALEAGPEQDVAIAPKKDGQRAMQTDADSETKTLDAQKVLEGSSEGLSGAERVQVDEIDDAEAGDDEGKSDGGSMQASEVAQEQPSEPPESGQELSTEPQSEREVPQLHTEPPTVDAGKTVVEVDENEGDEVLEDDDARDMDEAPSEMVVDGAHGPTATDSEPIASSEKTVPSEAETGDKALEMVMDIAKEPERPAFARAETSGERTPFETVDEDKGDAVDAEAPMTTRAEDTGAPEATGEDQPRESDRADEIGHFELDTKMDDREDSEKQTSAAEKSPHRPDDTDDKDNAKKIESTTVVAETERRAASATNERGEMPAIEIAKPRTDTPESMIVPSKREDAVLDAAQIEGSFSTPSHERDAMEIDKRSKAVVEVSNTPDINDKSVLADETPVQGVATIFGTGLKGGLQPSQRISMQSEGSKAPVTEQESTLPKPEADKVVVSGERGIPTIASDRMLKSSEEGKGASEEGKGASEETKGVTEEGKGATKLSPPELPVSSAPTSTLPRSSGPATIMTPMFGIEPPNRLGPVSFSSPPSFHRPRLSPTAAPFVPPALRTKKSPEPPATAAVPGTMQKIVEEPSDLGIQTDAAKDDHKAPDSDEAESMRLVSGPSPKVEAGTRRDGDKQTLDGATPKPILKKVKPEQKLRRIPIKGTSGGMIYSVENVSVFVKEGTARPVRRGALCTIEVKTRPDDESTMEFSEGRNSSKSVFAFLSSKKDRVKIKKVVNRAFVMAVTVLGPSGQEKGDDVSKYFVHLQEHTFQVFYDACMMFKLDAVTKKDRPKAVRFQEPPTRDQKSVEASVSSPVKTPVKQASHTNVPKVASMDQKKLLLQKMEALKKKKAERSSDASPKRDSTHVIAKPGQKAAKSSTPGALSTGPGTETPRRNETTVSKPNRSVKSSTPVMKPITPIVKPIAPVGNAKVATLAEPESIVGSTSTNVPPQLQLLKPKTRQVPSSPKKRPAFRMEERAETSVKKARLNVPKKRMLMGANAKENIQGRPMSSVTGSANASKRQTEVAPSTVKMDVDGDSQAPATHPTALPNAISVVLKKPPAAMNITFEERERLELDSKRLADLLMGMKSAGDLGVWSNTSALPTSLQRCEPKSVSDFFDRLHTFRPSTWRGFAPEHALSPVECSRRGWYNSGIDQLTSTDGAEITAQFGSCHDYDSIAKEEERIRNLILGHGHKLLSGWIGESCPIEFETLEGSSRVYSSADLSKNADQLRKTDAVEILDKGGTNWEMGCETITGVDKCAKLAAFNWRSRVSNEEDLDLQCDWCNRAVLLVPECLVGTNDVGTVTFNPRHSHYPFCPFRGTENAVNRNAMAMGIISGTTAEAVTPVAVDGDTKMSDS